MWTLVKSQKKIENFREFWGQKITQKEPKMSFYRYKNIWKLKTQELQIRYC